ncbi:MAG: hypothetical protein A2Y91_06480 [Chloroflexi bacterium RBG_13_54_8]|nr:MAG: hypothetical protein A2Y91_06480 [Chloroflexi bacterium RBG_13_54_8]
MIGAIIAVIVAVFLFLFLVLPSVRIIGPTEIGLVIRKFGAKKLTSDNPIAFDGEAGYQSEMLMPGWRWKFWMVYKVIKFSWLQIPAGQIGVVIAQVGKPLPIGAKSAVYKGEFGNFEDLKKFVDNGGQKGVQRPVLPPGTLAPIHPVGFLVITKEKVYGLPISPELVRAHNKKGLLTPEDFGLRPEWLDVTVIRPQPSSGGKIVDMIGIVTTLEGDPLPPGDIASRLSGFDDIAEAEKKEATDSQLIEKIIGSKNTEHNNYQDFQEFLDKGGKIGLQHDPLLYGAYLLNPFLVKVGSVPMLVVEQGQVAVIKSYVGLAEESGRVVVAGEQFKFGTLVRPGHRGIWKEPLRTGKYAINPHCYNAEIVPTIILTLNWAKALSKAHELDANLSPIDAKSREGFMFHIDLQVQIHVADTEAPFVISMVGTMSNLVNEVLQPAVGNHFRDKLQSMPAVKFIETRQQVQEEAFRHIQDHLGKYKVETKGAYIQDVILPEQLVQVLTSREIANQEIETYKKQREAQDQRTATEQARGTAEMQAELAKARVGVEIKQKNAEARKAEADGEATYIEKTGTAQGAQVRAVGMARADAYKAQIEALGPEGTTLVNAITAMADKNLKFVPEVMVGGVDGGSIGGLISVLTGKLASEMLKPKSTEQNK